MQKYEAASMKSRFVSVISSDDSHPPSSVVRTNSRNNFLSESFLPTDVLAVTHHYRLAENNANSRTTNPERLLSEIFRPIFTMKRLSEERTKLIFEKLTKYIGGNVKLLIDRPGGVYCFREQRERVYYVSEKILALASTVAPENLISFGTCFGRFTKSGKFKLHITALHYLAPYAQYKIWLKSSAEQQFLYGHHVSKSGLGRITENTAQYQGVVVYSMNDLPLGFGVAAKSTADCRHADPMSTICFHQADIGEYIRSEDTLM